MWNVDQSYMTIILKLKNCRTNRVTHEVFAECGKIRGMRDNNSKCVTGGNPSSARLLLISCLIQPPLMANEADVVDENTETSQLSLP